MNDDDNDSVTLSIRSRVNWCERDDQPVTTPFTPTQEDLTMNNVETIRALHVELEDMKEDLDDAEAYIEQLVESFDTARLTEAFAAMQRDVRPYLGGSLSDYQMTMAERAWDQLEDAVKAVAAVYRKAERAL